MSLAIVTATTSLKRAEDCLATWWGDVPIYVVVNGSRNEVANVPAQIRLIDGGDYLGSVAAFAKGVDQALADGVEIIACLHDDLAIHDRAWAQKVEGHFKRNPACGLLGFGGAIGLGAADIYQIPYEPMQLARVGFRSNLVDAEVHGLRSLLPERVACLDGFSQIGRADFWRGIPNPQHGGDHPPKPVLWQLRDHGMVHHAYDSALGLAAAIDGWEVWYLPIRAHHFGGRTAVGDAGYQAWAHTQTDGGDHGFWETAHKALYELGRGTLPIRV